MAKDHGGCVGKGLRGAYLGIKIEHFGYKIQSALSAAWGHRLLFSWDKVPVFSGTLIECLDLYLDGEYYTTISTDFAIQNGQYGRNSGLPATFSNTFSFFI